MWQMRGAGVTANFVTYNATISACEKGGKPEHALQLIEALQGRGMEPDAIHDGTSSSNMSSASETGIQPEVALQLVEAMQQRGLEPDVITFNALISVGACSCSRRCSVEECSRVSSLGPQSYPPASRAAHWIKRSIYSWKRRA